MKKNYLHTSFIKYLIEKHTEEDVEVQPDELEELQPEESTHYIPDDEKDDQVEDDEVIDKLLIEYKKIKSEYDNRLSNKKRS